jgi:hypothetical protein
MIIEPIISKATIQCSATLVWLSFALVSMGESLF